MPAVKIIDLNRVQLTGIEMLDAEHVVLVNLVNEFYENMLKCPSLEKELSLTEQFIGRFIRQLETYSGMEKEYARLADNEKLAERQKRKDTLLQQLRAFNQQGLSYGSSFEVFQLAIKGLAQHFIFGRTEDR